LDINFSNICNLSCAMCSSEFSSSWIRKDKQIMDKFDFRKHASPYTQVETVPESFVEQIDLEELEMIEIKGGEPTMDVMVLYFLNKLLKESPETYIHLTSNMVNLPDEFKEIIEQLPNVSIDVSIDGIGDVYKYIRGVHINKVQANLKYLSTLKNIKELRVNVTTSPYNLWDSHLLIGWVHVVVPNAKINWCPITITPDYLNPTVIPHELRLEAAQTLNSLHWCPDSYTIDLIPTIEYIKSDNPKNIPHDKLRIMRNNFIRWTDQMNEWRNMNIYDIVPQLEKARNIILND